VLDFTALVRAVCPGLAERNPEFADLSSTANNAAKTFLCRSSDSY